MSEHTITINNKKYPYRIKKGKGGIFHFYCKSANINQKFHEDDLAELLLDLPQWITERQTETVKESYLRFRVKKEDKKKIQKIAVNKGFNNMSDYLRCVALGGCR